jgi:hypothetical protein
MLPTIIPTIISIKTIPANSEADKRTIAVDSSNRLKNLFLIDVLEISIQMLPVQNNITDVSIHITLVRFWKGGDRNTNPTNSNIIKI